MNNTENNNFGTNQEIQFQIGDFVAIDSTKRGFVRYVGPTKFRPGIWVGVELEGDYGKNDGSVDGYSFLSFFNRITYFDCPKNKGLFLQPSKLFLLKKSSAFISTSQVFKTRNRSATIDNNASSSKESLNLKQRPTSLLAAAGLEQHKELPRPHSLITSKSLSHHEENELTLKQLKIQNQVLSNELNRLKYQLEDTERNLISSQKALANENIDSMNTINQNELKELLNKNNKICAELEIIRKERDQLLAKVNDLEKIRSPDNEKIEQLEFEMSMLQAELSLRKNDSQEFDNQTDSIKEECLLLKSQLEGLKSEMNSLKTLLDNKNQELIRLQETNNAREKELQVVKSTFVSIDKENDKYEKLLFVEREKVVNLEQDLEKHTQLLNEKDSVISSLMSKLDSAQKESITAFEASKKELVKRNEELNLENQGLSLHLSELQKEIEEKEDLLKFQSESLKEENNNLTKINKELNSKYSNIQDEISNIKIELDKVKEEKRHLEHLNQNIANERKDDLKKIEKLQDEIITFQNLAEEKSLMLLSMEKQSENLQKDFEQKRNALELELFKRDENVTLLKDEIDNLKQIIQFQQDTINSLKSENFNENEEISFLKKLLENEKENSNQLKIQKSDIEFKLREKENNESQLLDKLQEIKLQLEDQGLLIETLKVEKEEVELQMKIQKNDFESEKDSLNKDLELKINSLKSKMNSLELENSDLRRKTESNSVSKLTIEQISLKSTIQAEEIDDLKKALKKKENDEKETIKRIDDLIRRNEELELTTVDLQSRIESESLKRIKSSDFEEIQKTLAAEKATFATKVSQLEKQLTSLKLQKTEYENEKVLLLEEISSLKERIDIISDEKRILENSQSRVVQKKPAKVAHFNSMVSNLNLFEENENKDLIKIQQEAQQLDSLLIDTSILVSQNQLVSKIESFPFIKSYLSSSLTEINNDDTFLTKLNDLLRQNYIDNNPSTDKFNQLDNDIPKDKSYCLYCDAFDHSTEQCLNQSQLICLVLIVLK
ncbi:CAP Gly-rich domain-containing protein [Rozella allomycis CSF55]|uniref:CAP Gly-rich domain-containing protein n=1 Tax=Rozella allomycis (strain CSF55) TaxID=988480 RepID=A0A075B2Y6_ROZAC|nr:CAP Gly-rich domain-containing protein [Rozella allomycis CSF55]|eukprot:EPZ35138.1 CAP Gly-rich domain-containing protein [Rozella allomycis CSF55]